MAKVVNKKGLQAGTASAGKSAATIDGKTEILATRNGTERTFKKLTWDFLPINRDGSRDGWVEVSDAPSAPKLKIVDKSDEEKALETAKENYLSVFGVAAEDDSTVESIEQDINEHNLLNEGGGTEGMVDFTIDQDFLDTHPDIAESGKKVGDVIKVLPEANQEPEADKGTVTNTPPAKPLTAQEKRKATLAAKAQGGK